MSKGKNVRPEEKTDPAMELFRSYLEKMEASDLKIYIECRIIEQIGWYNRKSERNQRMYKWLSFFSIVLNGLIPIAVLFSDWGFPVKVLIAALSAAAGMLSSLLVLGNHKDLWIRYRANCELLQSTLLQFFARSGPFEDLEADPGIQLRRLSGICEAFLASEFQKWVSSTERSTLHPSN